MTYSQKVFEKKMVLMAGLSAYLPELKRFLRKVYPPFVTAPSPAFPLTDNIPVFTFHTVRKEIFEEQLGFLEENDYRTLDAEELFKRLAGGEKTPGRNVVLTFDDGESSLYNVAFPLLKKFGFRAVAFIIPSFIGQANTKQAGKQWLGWDEIEQMHKSGIIDFQSHTLRHEKIFIGDEIIDFCHPGIFVDELGLDVPTVASGGNRRRLADFGAPVYKTGSRMGKCLRYLDDEALRDDCIGYVREHGGASFFERKMWRRELRRFLRGIGRGTAGRFESPQEQSEAISTSLIEAKEMLQSWLNKKISHLAYPWGYGCGLSVSLSKSAGYKTNFWGPLPGVGAKVTGADPYYIPRLKDDYLFRLPGKGRKPLAEIFRYKLARRIKMRDIY